MSRDPVLLWFRRDLRVSDNTALHQACARKVPVLPVFIFDPEILKKKKEVVRRTAFLLSALESLSANLDALGAPLILRKGNPVEVLRALVKETGARTLFLNNDIEPYSRQRDEKVSMMLKEEGVEIVACDDLMIHPPGSVQRAAGGPYTVFTPFSLAWKAKPPHDPLPRPAQIQGWTKTKGISFPTLGDLGLEKCDIPVPAAGEKSAQELLRSFVRKNITRYETTRNLPFQDSTSHLSPHLRFGTLSPRTVLAAARRVRSEDPASKKEVDVFIGELIWRDFYKQILWEFPHVATRAFRPAYDKIEWENRTDRFQAWCEGQTGFPIVDAAMRQLNQTGWMHNRLRMIVSSFLTKDLLVSWQWGERYFMEKLFDGDLAANNGGWQWAAGTGTDAQPYFRIFNPTSQAEKFDSEGKFIARYVPEATSLSYPAPIVDHSTQRLRALEMYKAARE
ncbi:MAG: deoxyribodipyrimidine photo-lyase [Verrucomicrobia bacterium]|nr:deoxyribodipyrimidine photo-lyase [Verrucomicrobiota bacterium]